MANYSLNKTVYPKSIYENVIDTSFTQNQPSIPLEDTVTTDQFFELYNSLFYDIPAEGDTNSHAYLVQRSGEYINADGTSEVVQVLLDEITSLQQEILVLNEQIIQLQTTGSK